MNRGNGDLPEGWVATTLGNVRLDLSKSIDPRKSGDERFELYSVPSFSGRRPEIVSGDTIGSSKRMVEPNSVLLCKINPRINRAWVVRNYSEYRKIASTEWLCFSELSGLFPDFICYYLQQHAFRDHLAANASGVGGSLMRVKGTTFADYSFPLPPLPEQRRIVAEIEKQFTRLDASVAALKRVQANLERYRASVLKAACEGTLVPTEAELARAENRDYEPADRLLDRILAERRARWKAQEKRRGKYKEPVAPDTSALPELPEGWVWSGLDQLITVLKNGFSKPPRGKSGTAILRISAVRPMAVDVRDIRWVGDAERLSGFLLSTGDLLFTRYNGNPSLVGVCGVVPALGRDTLHPDKLIRACLTKGGALPSLVQIVANSGMSRTFLERRIRTTAGQSGISGADLKSMPIPLPPLAEQRRIVAEVERRLSVIQQAEAAVEANLVRAERLRQSILKQAFSGKLVPQDPGDEPASVLLNRIRAEREAAQAAARADRKPKRRPSKKRRVRQPARREAAS